MEVLGAHLGRSPRGGVLHDNLLTASQQALATPRSEARSRAMDFTWAQAAQLFQQYLVTARSAAVTGFATVTKPVTSLSSGR